MRQFAYCVGRYAGNRLHYFGMEVLGIGLQGIKSAAPVFGKVFVVKLFINYHFNKAQGKGTISTRADWNPLGIGSGYGLGAARVNHYDISATLRGCLQAVHIYRRGICGGISAPDNHHLGILNIREHVYTRPAHSNLRSNHMQGYIAERADACSIG
ncbi:hypothetical protein ES703_50069 [subsurface metagenome]